jgi:thiamine kinase-like enzyme
MGVVPSVEDVLGHVAMFSGRDVTLDRIEGGLSHQIFLVRCDGQSYVLRLLDPAVSAAGLGLPPGQEISNTVRAADSGVGAKVYEVVDDLPTDIDGSGFAAVVLEFLPGPTLSAQDVRLPATAARIAAACRRLHAGPRFGNDFSILDKRSELLSICRRNELRLPEGYLDRGSTVDRIGAVLAAVPARTVPCHNDLLAENFIDSDGVIRIVDYQLAGNNDPSFELGDIAAEAQLDPDRTEALASAYFGDEFMPALAARVRLNQLLSDITWTLWFTVHHALLRNPTSSFDYWGEANDKWARAVRGMDAPEFSRLLDAVSGSVLARPRTDSA